MRILIYGAGNIGCLYAARLAESGQVVAILARGDRYTELSQHGITLKSADLGDLHTTSVSVVDRLKPSDAYDLVLVVLPKHALDDVLPVLAANDHTPCVMFFGNNVCGPAQMTDALAEHRVLLGFPGAAAVPDNGATQYLITSRQEQPTTIGELDGSRSDRIAGIKHVFELAGFPTSVSGNMDAWLKTHAAKILPTVGALFFAGGRLERLTSNDEAIRLMVRAIRECFEILCVNEIPLTPSNHRVLLWLPESLTVFLMKRMLSTKSMNIKIGHAHHAVGEFSRLAQDFMALNACTHCPTPALDRLFEHFPQMDRYD